MSRVVVAMSGGVDSSVAAARLAEAGHEVIGLTMRLWTEPRPEAFRGRTQCCAAEDIDDARRVAQRLGVPHYTLNLEKPFRRFVVDAFVEEYARGRTPNPCLNCNTFIKFDAFLERALALRADYIATGHYARRVERDGAVELHRARDAAKDQSYVLYTLSPRALDRTLFPIGDLPKAEVRAIAARHGLAVADKPDSADICFVPGGDYREFVRRRLPDRPACSTTPTARSWASTPACSTSPSASGAAWAWRRASPASSRPSTRRQRRPAGLARGTAGRCAGALRPALAHRRPTRRPAAGGAGAGARRSGPRAPADRLPRRRPARRPRRAALRRRPRSGRGPLRRRPRAGRRHCRPHVAPPPG